MEKVQDFKALGREIMSCMRPGMVTNCTLGGDALRRLTEAEALYAHRYDGGLLLVEKKPQFSLLRFYLTNPEAAAELPVAQTLLCETVRQPEKPDAAAAWLQKCGFSSLFTRIRMERQSATADDAVLSESLDGAALHDLFSACFPAETGCIPTAQELTRAAAEGRILTKMDSGRLCGAIHAEKRKGYTELRHLAVLPDCRGRGYAMQLTSRFCRVFGGEKLRVWVRDDALSAKHIYEENGFSPDGYTATVWKKEG